MPMCAGHKIAMGGGGGGRRGERGEGGESPFWLIIQAFGADESTAAAT